MRVSIDKRFLRACLALTLSLLMASCFISMPKKKNKEGPIKILAGSSIPSLGVAFDASYDSRFDNTIPGYKILNVAITNNSINIINMDPINDEWSVVDVRGKKHRAIKDLRKRNPDAYSKLPQKLRTIVSYPVMVQVGDTKVLDLLFPHVVKLDGFRAVKFKLNNFGKDIIMTTRD